MTAKEKLTSIIKQKGKCHGFACTNLDSSGDIYADEVCPLYSPQFNALCHISLDDFAGNEIREERRYVQALEVCIQLYGEVTLMEILM